MSEYTINYSVDGWPICKNGEPIFRKKLLLAELQQLQARIKELEAINLGLTKTLLEEESEKEKLVGVLEQVIKAAPIAEARSALAAYRKQGSE